MTGRQLSRLSGLALVVGAAAFIVHLVARSLLTAGYASAVSAQNGLWVPINALGAIGAALLLLGMPAMYARMAEPSGRLGLAGVVLIALAWMFFGVFLSLFSALVMPWLAARAPSLLAADASIPAAFLVAFVVSLVAQIAGIVLLATPFVRGRVAPRWIGFLLLAAAAFVVLGDAVAPSGPASNLALNLLSNLGPVLLSIAFGYLGLQMWAAPICSGDS
jgi:hypothetical protein